VVLHEDADEQALKEYVAQREPRGAELVLAVRSWVPRPTGQPAPWRWAASGIGRSSNVLRRT
jgi:hypothetical protein